MPTIFTRGAASASGFGLFGVVATNSGLWSWGKNNSGQLGLGNITNYSSPKQVSILTTWSKLTGGNASAFAIKTDGTMWSWGYNGNPGSLGLNDTAPRSSPSQIGALTTWSKVFSGAYRNGAFAIKTDGTLWAWGTTSFGQLGNGYSTGYVRSPIQIGALTNWSEAAATGSFSLAVKTDGTLWSWGQNNSGQLGLGNLTNYSSPKQVGALTTWSKVQTGGNLSLAVKTNGTLWSWGYNGNGRLGLGNLTDYSSPKQIGALTTWATISASLGLALAVKTDGTLWSWGQNSSGQLGLGNLTDYSSPVQVGALTTWSKVKTGGTSSIALKTDGTLWSWGSNNTGRLGLGNTTNYSSPKQIGALTAWFEIAAINSGSGLAIQT